MMRPCPRCGVFKETLIDRNFNRPARMLVIASWVRQDGIVGRRLECSRCGHQLRSYEVLRDMKGPLRHIKAEPENQLPLVLPR